MVLPFSGTFPRPKVIENAFWESNFIYVRGGLHKVALKEQSQEKEKTDLERQ